MMQRKQAGSCRLNSLNKNSMNVNKTSSHNLVRNIPPAQKRKTLNRNIRTHLKRIGPEPLFFFAFFGVVETIVPHFSL